MSPLTIPYIIAVNPAIQHATGIPVGPSMVATIAIVVFGALAMGLHASCPFAIAPYTGDREFFADTVARVMGYLAQAPVIIGFMMMTRRSRRIDFNDPPNRFRPLP